MLLDYGTDNGSSRRVTRSPSGRRRGVILPFLVLTLIALFAFVALAIDIGMIAVARAQAQNAADTAAMTGARTLDGSATYNLDAATANAIAAATSNDILSVPIRPEHVTIEHGAYHYNDTDETFSPMYPPLPVGENYNLTRATVTSPNNSAFARVLGINTFTVTATAVAAHRPRDITIVLDFSGSMNNESDLYNNEGYLGSANNSPNNTEAVFPRFGHYSSSSANLQSTSSDPRVGKSNVSHAVLGIPPLVRDFYQHPRGSGASFAFTSAPDTYETMPVGDHPPGVAGSMSNPPSTYAKTIQEITGASSAAITAFTDPKMPSYPSFTGYTQGPRYWGKTFFVWPPDPDLNTNGLPEAHPNYPTDLNDAPRDWRRKFFLKVGGTHPTFGGQMDDNTKLWDAAGNWRTPAGNYVINYRAILKWIKANPTSFPPMLRGGRVLYYDSIPDDVPQTAYDHTQLNHNIAWGSQNERFWKEYIDYAIGVWRSPANGIITPGSPACSYSPDFTWGTVRISVPYGPYAGGGTHAVNVNSTYRMHPQDNPKRPRHRFWFGPMTMIQFISDTGMLPGTAHDISMHPAKLGIAAALEDIRNNHPNDMVALILFNRPRFNGEALERGRFSQAQIGLSRDYTAMQNALWFPPNSGVLDVRPWDPNGLQTPRSGADYQANTCYNYGLMLAYNQFSANDSLDAAGTGGKGRKGATRLVIFETDGMANVAANANFVSAGKNSHYDLSSVSAGGSAGPAALAVVDRICALETDNVVGPGFAKPGRPVKLHCIAFGAVFEPNADGTDAANAITLLKDISTKGGTYFPSNSGDTEGYKMVIGTLDQRRDKLREAFRRITDSGASPALIE